MKPTKIFIWSASFVFVFIELFLTGARIYTINEDYRFDSSQLTTIAKTNDYLEKNWLSHKRADNEAPTYVPTGIFVESMKFRDANTVHASGYLWQKYDATNNHLKNRGAVFPEGVNIRIQESYRRIVDHVEVIGWYFEAEFIQKFEYKNFPLDHKVFWIRMWHQEFDRNVILVPDLVSYDSTATTDKFGLDPEIVLFGHSIAETFFNYKDSNYDTNFGIKNYVGQRGFPELYYNIALKRGISHSLIVYFLPLSVVFILLFFAILMISADDKSASLAGFNLANMTRVAALLIFIVILSHIQLRGGVSSNYIIYLEYVYFMAYVSILIMVLMSFVIGKRAAREFLPFLYWEDSILVKACYLPANLFFFTIITYKVL